MSPRVLYVLSPWSRANNKQWGRLEALVRTLTTFVLGINAGVIVNNRFGIINHDKNLTNTLRQNGGQNPVISYIIRH